MRAAAAASVYLVIVFIFFSGSSQGRGQSLFERLRHTRQGEWSLLIPPSYSISQSIKEQKFKVNLGELQMSVFIISKFR